MTNNNLPARRRLDGQVRVQNNQIANQIYFEAALILSLFALIMFAISLGVYSPFVEAASNSVYSADKKRAVGGPETDEDFIKTDNLVRHASIFKNGKDRTGGIQFSVFPVRGRMSDSYGSRPNPFGTGATEFHAGMDVSAPSGTPVVAAAEGVVVFSGVKGGYGNCVIIEHAGKEIATRYAHLSQLDVRVGERVAAGSQIGLVGSTGRSTGPHLHYEVRIDGKAQNPRAFYASSRF